MVEVTTTCRWRGEPFAIDTATDGQAYVRYRGSRADVCDWPGMVMTQTGVLGRIPEYEVTEIEETEKAVDLEPDPGPVRPSG